MVLKGPHFVISETADSRKKLPSIQDCQYEKSINHDQKSQQGPLFCNFKNRKGAEIPWTE